MGKAPGAKQWYETSQAGEIPSPALLVYPERIEENIRRMISIAGTPSALRPHVKTHKMPAIVNMQRRLGIEKFKCSTLSEVEMAAKCGAKEITLAMQPVGPQITGLFGLVKKYPAPDISVIADDVEIIRQLSSMAVTGALKMGVWLDINNGMNRTGIIPGRAFDVYRKICELPGLVALGLHVYDGHIHDENIDKRTETVEKAYKPVHDLIVSLTRGGFPVPAVIAGGTPSFPIHARHGNVETSPGTLILWDAGYGERYRDLDFLYGAVLLTRVVSLPDRNLLCLDLGHKAIAAEMPHPRVRLIGLPPHEFVNHSEEHLVIKLDGAEKYKPGDVIYGIPWHICPTVARYPFAYAVRDNAVTETWQIEARDRVLSFPGKTDHKENN
jgi:D-serine deaminase-like pyridoxal phosphate-dependent protein